MNPDNNIKWTKLQRKAIDSFGADVLVSASAGTGKTAVLSQRCVNILADTKNKTDVSQMLVLTYTEAAAKEMSTRIAQNLADQYRLNRQPYLRKQILNLDAAQISTIHSFCRKLIADNFFLLGIDPSFTIIDSDEQIMLKYETLEKTIEQTWQNRQMFDRLNQLLYLRKANSSQSGFFKNILSISDFLENIANPEDWLQKAQMLNDNSEQAMNYLAQQQKKILLKTTQQLKMLTRQSIILDKKIFSGHWTDQLNNDLLTVFEQFENCISNENFTQAAHLIENFSFKFKNKPKSAPEDLVKAVKSNADKAKSKFLQLTSWAILNPDYEKIVKKISEQTRTVIDITKLLQDNFLKAKTKLNCMDFADLQQLTLKLLNQNPELTRQIQDRFKYIFVDEYQDINNLQQEILDKISKHDNMFVVGDIKQSIYAFRQANPQHFLEKLDYANLKKQNNKSKNDISVYLRENFRSKKQILDFANRIFSRIMTKQTASMDYDEKASLIAAGSSNNQTDNSQPLTELCIIDDDSSKNQKNQNEDTSPDDEYSATSAQRQAFLIAEHIKKMTDPANPLMITEKNTNIKRPVKYSDMVILMRSLSKRVNQFVEILQLAEIPVNSSASAGYFARTEITDMLSMLKVLENPLQDIELAALLRGPMLNIQDDDLAKVRLFHNNNDKQKTSLYDSVIQYIQNAPQSRTLITITEAMEKIQNWRSLAAAVSVADLIWHIIRQTGYLAFVKAMPNGRQRYANLLKLHDRAIQFQGFASSASTHSLTRFIEFINKMLESDRDWAMAEPVVQNQNSVRIMSVHKSKGLEFPVVFIANMEKGFNKKDLAEEILLDDNHTMGIRIIDPENDTKKDSGLRQIIAEKKKTTMLAEEMRILYVALTRPRERLILIGSKSIEKCAQLIKSIITDTEDTISASLLNEMNNHLDWLLCALFDEQNLRKKLQLKYENAKNTSLLDVSLFSAEKLDNSYNRLLTANSRKNKTKQAAPSNEKVQNLANTIQHKLQWQYPNKNLTNLAAKTSVTELTHQGDEFKPENFQFTLRRLPACMSGTTPAADPRSIGLAAHLVMEKIDLSQSVTPQNVTDTIEKLIDDGAFSEQLAKKLDPRKIADFFHKTQIGKMALLESSLVHREWTFTSSVKHQPDDFQIVQGIVDMVIETKNSLHIVDFKTDNVSHDQVEKRAALYKTQLKIYSKAAQDILKKPAQSAHLYFLKPAVLYKIT